MNPLSPWGSEVNLNAASLGRAHAQVDIDLLILDSCMGKEVLDNQTQIVLPKKIMLASSPR